MIRCLVNRYFWVVSGIWSGRREGEGRHNPRQSLRWGGLTLSMSRRRSAQREGYLPAPLAGGRLDAQR